MQPTIKIGVIIPDRGDRPRFMQNCIRMLKAQTLQPLIIIKVDDAPLNERCDITWRYKKGYEILRKKGLDLIAFIENDDWYRNDYLETMAEEWKKQGQPDILGTNYTIYYHIKAFAHFTMHHLTRSSAMSTVIKPDLDFKWCADDEPYTDMHLWCELKGIVFNPQKHICLGIKHGEGLCGGWAHQDRMHRYVNIDTDLKLLRDNMDEESFNFYTNYFNDNTTTPVQGQG